LIVVYLEASLQPDEVQVYIPKVGTVYPLQQDALAKVVSHMNEIALDLDESYLLDKISLQVLRWSVSENYAMAVSLVLAVDNSVFDDDLGLESVDAM
jgi:hypothetical protein